VPERGQVLAQAGRIVVVEIYKDRDRVRGCRNLGNVIVIVMICKKRDIPRPFVIEPLFETLETCAMGRLLFGGLTLCDKGDNLRSDVTT
jgi:hypothetical protein